MIEYVEVGLTFVTIGLAAAIFCHFVLRRRVPGDFWGALIVGLIGAVLGGLLDQALAGVIERLSHFNTVNVFAAAFCAFLLIWAALPPQRLTAADPSACSLYVLHGTPQGSEHMPRTMPSFVDQVGDASGPG